MNIRCIAANGAWIASSWPAARAFRNGMDRVADVQREILLRIVRRNAQTAFGRSHGFATIRSIDDYRARVAIRDYDAYAADLRRVEAGAANVLTASRVEHFEPTSGSAGAAKLIPFTTELREEIGRAIAPWICASFASDPRAFTGQAYWSLSPVGVQSRETSGGIRIGFDADDEYLGKLQRAFVRTVQAVPSRVREIADIDEFRSLTLDFLTRCRSLSFISVWHPSFLSLLVSSIANTAEVWPRLRVISCWADAGCAAPAARLAARFPHARIEPKGLLSTEGIVSIPIGAAAPALAYRSHFYEFRDCETERVVDDLAIGRRYDVILTTGGGLYRYETGDVVEIAGFARSCPLLRFVGRGRQVSDHFGEKLHEIFVRERLDRVLHEHGILTSFATLAFVHDRYVLLLECDIAKDRLAAIAARLDDLLRESFHYDYCRRLGQLAPLRAERIEGESLLRIAAETGQRLGDIKLSAITRDERIVNALSGHSTSREI